MDTQIFKLPFTMFAEEKIQTVIDALSYEVYMKKHIFIVSPVKEFKVLILNMEILPDP